jgi:hypothetical protein
MHAVEPDTPTPIWGPGLRVHHIELNYISPSFLGAIRKDPGSEKYPQTYISPVP